MGDVEGKNVALEACFAEGQVDRLPAAGRPGTAEYQRLPTARPRLRRAAGSLIAAPPSRLRFTSPARVTVLSAVTASCRNIWSGPEALALQVPQRAYV
jgi:hypothetical protein